MIKDPLQPGFSDHRFLINEINHFVHTHTHTHNQPTRRTKTVYSRKKDVAYKKYDIFKEAHRIFFIRRKEKTRIILEI